MRQKTGMYTAIAEIHGHRLIIQSIIHPLLLNRRRPSLHLNILQHNLLLQKVVLPVHFPNPADQRHPVKCRALRVTGPGVAQAPTPGAVAEEPVEGVEVAGAVEVEAVVLEEGVAVVAVEEEEDKSF
jgi:hypothetical protein